MFVIANIHCPRLMFLPFGFGHNLSTRISEYSMKCFCLFMTLRCFLDLVQKIHGASCIRCVFRAFCGDHISTCICGFRCPVFLLWYLTFSEYEGSAAHAMILHRCNFALSQVLRCLEQRDGFCFLLSTQFSMGPGSALTLGSSTN